MVDPIARIVVYGTPGTAGSKSAFPLLRTGPDGTKQFVKTVQVEKDLKKVKANWRTAVMAAALGLIVEPGTDRIMPPFPLDEALEASMVFTVKKPSSAPKTARSWPISRPDTLKYARATEDALMAAGVLKDDSRVVRYRELAKVFPREHELALDVPGAVILLWRKAETARDLVDAVDLTLFDPMTPPGGVTAAPPPGVTGGHDA